MNFLSSFLKYGSTKHWKRYSWMEKWKAQKLSNLSSPRIVDVGAGHDPFRDANYIIDKYHHDNTQRGRDIKLGNRKLIVSSVESVPVEDGYFDFSYARQVLEHVEDPQKACDELMRISKRGFIETPNSFSELGYGYPGPERGWSYHKWYNWIDDDGVLVFRRKTKDNINDYCKCMFGNFCHQLYHYYQGNFKKFIKKLPYPLRAYSFVWDKSFKYRVIHD